MEPTYGTSLFFLIPTALDRDERIVKFRFRYLGIVEDVSVLLCHCVPSSNPWHLLRTLQTTRIIMDDVIQAQPKYVVVKV